MTATEARARCAALDLREWDDSAMTDAILAATTALLAVSPQVTPVAGTPGMWWVGATGFDALGGETALADALLALAQRWHPGARVAIADSCVAARAATWAPRPPADPTLADPTLADPTPERTLIPHGHCAAYLAPAPLGLVPMAESLRDGLRALGLRTVGALAALAPGAVEVRWGAEGLAAWRLARGEDPRRPGLVRVERPRSSSVELPAPVEQVEPVLFLLRAQLQRLLHDCVQDGRAVASIALTLVLDAGRVYPIAEEEPSASIATATPTAETLLAVPHRSITREVRPARPLARLEPLFDQCRALLEQWRIPAPIIGLTVAIPATAPLAADQGDLLVPSWRDAAMTAEAVCARLRVVLDPEQRGDVIVRPVARATHRIEATGHWIPAEPVPLAAAPLPAGPPAVEEATTAVLRLLTPAEPVEVERPHGLLEAMWWRGQRVGFVRVEGPERLSGDWWTGAGYARDYWRGHAEEDGVFLLYHETDGRWYLHGWYD